MAVNLEFKVPEIGLAMDLQLQALSKERETKEIILTSVV